MSGSLVLRSGVGTQMFAVSSWVMTAEIRGGAELAGTDQGFENILGDVGDVRFPGVDPGYFRFAQVDTRDIESGPGELHRQRQPDVAEPDHSHLRFPVPYLFLKSFLHDASRREYRIRDRTRHLRLFVPDRPEKSLP
jgi:hypothetical protein